MRIKALFVVLCMLFSLGGSAFATEEAEIKPSRAQNAAEFTRQLGLTADINNDLSAYIKRSEFFALAVRAMNVTAGTADSKLFSDVKKDNLFFDEVNAARILGLTNGTDENIFSPDEKVVFSVAAKALVTVLGYGDIASAKGGYPTGYLVYADRLGLDSGVENKASYSELKAGHQAK